MLIQGIIFQITFKIMINFETQEFVKSYTFSY